MPESEQPDLDYAPEGNGHYLRCKLCGAVVAWRDVHNAWHRSLYPAFRAIREVQSHEEIVTAIAEAAEAAGMTYGQAVCKILRVAESVPGSELDDGDEANDAVPSDYMIHPLGDDLGSVPRKNFG